LGKYQVLWPIEPPLIGGPPLLYAALPAAVRAEAVHEKSIAPTASMYFSFTTNLLQIIT
jgi:hypothetical protein